ncbi:efflux RND transporter periplasmic adaptor subunit [Marinicella sp. W31]|uniref:efflux RND transporter periplasmic adaptor subunit n=1 Tax=Marinicella sp. W31 TaxID=3023713 RepID=UPI0037578EC7
MNKAYKQRIVIWFLISLVVMAGLVYVMWPRPIFVDLDMISKGPLAVAIRDEGETRVHDIYNLSAPVTGRLRRIDLDVGDEVVISDTVVAEIEPIDPEFLDPRSEAQAKADIQTAQSARDYAQAQVTQAQAELEFALSELTRMRDLVQKESISQREMDNAEREYKTRRAALATAQASLQMRNYELEKVEAILLSPTETQDLHGTCECLNIVAPVSGKVLKILHKSEGVITAGTPLLEIGNPNQLEIFVELLSSDAVQVENGQTVNISNWGGEEQLQGVVSRIEPIGFTKVSALGIEEQRVNVIIDFTSPLQQRRRLGHGYQVDVEVVLWESESVLKVPLTALFRDQQQQWSVFVEVQGKARKRQLQLGYMNSLNAEVLQGLKEGEVIVLHPNEKIRDGVQVRARHSSSL